MNQQCQLRVPELERRFQTPFARIGTGHVGGGCGCEPVVSKTRAVGALAAHDVPARCRRNLEEYGWLLGCWEMQTSDAAAACGLDVSLLDDSQGSLLQHGGTSAGPPKGGQGNQLAGVATAAMADMQEELTALWGDAASASASAMLDG